MVRQKCFKIEAHKIIISASSPFFKNNKHSLPLIYMKGIKANALVSVLDFVYYGEVNIFPSPPPYSANVWISAFFLFWNFPLECRVKIEANLSELDGGRAQQKNSI